jgi:hypothetical protein
LLYQSPINYPRYILSPSVFFAFNQYSLVSCPRTQEHTSSKKMSSSITALPPANKGPTKSARRRSKKSSDETGKAFGSSDKPVVTPDPAPKLDQATGDTTANINGIQKAASSESGRQERESVREVAKSVHPTVG